MANNLHYRHLPASRGGARPTGLSVINTCSPRNLLSSLLWAIGRWEEVGASPSSDDRLCAHVSQLQDPAALPVPSLLWDNLTSTDPDVCGGPWKRVSKVPVRVGLRLLNWCGCSYRMMRPVQSVTKSRAASVNANTNGDKRRALLYRCSWRLADISTLHFMEFITETCNVHLGTTDGTDTDVRQRQFPTSTTELYKVFYVIEYYFTKLQKSVLRV